MMRFLKLKYNYRSKALKILENSPIPMAIETIRVKTGIKSWVTTKSLLLELLIENRIFGQKTTKSWIFWAKSTNNVGD